MSEGTLGKLRAVGGLAWNEIKSTDMVAVQQLGSGGAGDVSLVRCGDMRMARKRLRTAGRDAAAKMQCVMTSLLPSVGL